MRAVKQLVHFGPLLLGLVTVLCGSAFCKDWIAHEVYSHLFIIDFSLKFGPQSEVWFFNAGSLGLRMNQVAAWGSAGDHGKISGGILPWKGNWKFQGQPRRIGAAFILRWDVEGSERTDPWRAVTGLA